MQRRGDDQNDPGAERRKPRRNHRHISHVVNGVAEAFLRIDEKRLALNFLAEPYRLLECQVITRTNRFLLPRFTFGLPAFEIPR
jgi:hypothetical protein